MTAVTEGCDGCHIFAQPTDNAVIPGTIIMKFRNATGG